VAPTNPRVVVGGVGHLYQGDLDLGRLAVERLSHDDLGGDVAIEEFSYGAVAVTQRLEELRPEVLVLVGAVERGRQPGTVERREITSVSADPGEIQGAIADAVTGYIHLDLVLEVAHGLGVLPLRTVAIEVEPARTEPSEHLSAEAEAGLARAVELVRAEVRDDVLPDLFMQARNQNLREAIEEHIGQTRDHVAKLEEVFRQLEEKPATTPSHGLIGLRRQHEEALGGVAGLALRDLVHAGAAARTEHYEISAYHSLVTAAELLGEPEAVRLLEQNLHQEEGGAREAREVDS
jgi:hydrogenase maturation protease